MARSSAAGICANAENESPRSSVARSDLKQANVRVLPHRAERGAARGRGRATTRWLTARAFVHWPKLANVGQSTGDSTTVNGPQVDARQQSFADERKYSKELAVCVVPTVIRNYRHSRLW